MELTAERKAKIDSLSYKELLREWRFAPSGSNDWLSGETGDYWGARMNELKRADPDMAVRVSKELGWG